MLFYNRVSLDDLNNIALQSLGAVLTPEDQERLTQYRRKWNFYEGYHWEAIAASDKPEVTINYCRLFVNKFVSFEFGKGFSIKMLPNVEKIDGENDPLDFLNEVWKYNKKEKLLVEFGQTKSVTGDGFIGVFFEPKDIIDDPFGEYPNGRIRIIPLPSSICFPEYADSYDKDQMISFTIMYPVPINDSNQGIFRKNKVRFEIYKQVWTKERVEYWEGKVLKQTLPNKYGIIPIVHIKNLPLHGKTIGQGDLDDIIPINTEYNLKKSDISEIIDYHSAPVTVVFGARIGQLERGANKVWGGLPKDAKVENLHLEGDLVSAQNYISDLKNCMLEIGGIPESALGGDLAISNTSGIALQISLMPLVERINMKQMMTREGLTLVNKIILKIALTENLIEIPEGILPKEFYYNEIQFESVLPKDMLIELQQIEAEMKLQLMDREEAMQRLGKDNIQYRLQKIDEEVQKNPLVYGIKVKDDSLVSDIGKNKDGGDKKINSGVLNSPEPKLSF